MLSAHSIETTFLTETELYFLARLAGKQVPMSLLTQEWGYRFLWLQRADFLRVFETLVRGMSGPEKWVMSLDAFLCLPFGMRERSCHQEK